MTTEEFLVELKKSGLRFGLIENGTRIRHIKQRPHQSYCPLATLFNHKNPGENYSSERGYFAGRNLGLTNAEVNAVIVAADADIDEHTYPTAYKIRQRLMEMVD